MSKSKRIGSARFAALVIGAALFGGATSAQAGLFVNSAALEQSSQFAHDPLFQAVGWLGGSINSGQSFQMAGTAFIFKARDGHLWGMTAGHVVNPRDGRVFDTMIFGMGNNIFEDVNRYQVDAWFTHPGFSINDSPGKGIDVSIFRLVDPGLGIAPLPLYSEQPDVGTHFYVAGYGRPGIWPNEDPFDGIKRAGENNIDCYGCLVAVDDQYGLTFFEHINPSNFFEWQGSQFASGSPWIIDLDGQHFATGITGFGRGNFSTGALRTDFIYDWAYDTIAANSPPAVVPEPSSVLLFGLGMFFLGAVTWRQNKQGEPVRNRSG